MLAKETQPQEGWDSKDSDVLRTSPLSSQPEFLHNCVVMLVRPNSSCFAEGSRYRLSKNQAFYSVCISSHPNGKVPKTTTMSRWTVGLHL